MNNQPNKFNPPVQKPKSVVNHANFIEALKSTGSGIAKDTIGGFANDFIGGSVKQISDTIFDFGGSSNSQTKNQPGPQSNEEQPFDFMEYIKSSEQKTRAQDKVKYEYESQETILFNRREEETKQQIEMIRTEIRKVASEIIHLDNNIQKVIDEELVNPGQYHVNFFEKLLKFLQQMRKRVAEARHWGAMQNQRSQSKSYYWNMAGKKGTKFTQSLDRTVATQTG